MSNIQQGLRDHGDHRLTHIKYETWVLQESSDMQWKDFCVGAKNNNNKKFLKTAQSFCFLRFPFIGGPGCGRGVLRWLLKFCFLWALSTAFVFFLSVVLLVSWGLPGALGVDFSGGVSFPSLHLHAPAPLPSSRQAP